MALSPGVIGRHANTPISLRRTTSSLLLGDVMDRDLYFKAMDKAIEAHAKGFEKAVQYNNLVLVAGYAGAFTIWNFTRDQLNPHVSILVALLLGASLAVFVFFEVTKMATTTWLLQGIAPYVPAHPNDLVSFVKHVESVQSGLNRHIISETNVWATCLWTSVFTALLALALLFGNFVILLLPWGR
jgi:hypothetical protein